MGNKTLKYLNPKLSTEVRVKDLLKKMTVEEKVMQLCSIQPGYNPQEDILENGKLSYQKAKKLMGKGIGTIACALRGFEPRHSAELANEIQKFVIEHTRLKIPVIIHDECLHGCVAKGSTSYPQAIALSSTWEPELIEKIAIAIGKETRARGIQHALSPTINISRDPRCGRTEETYGEDTYLTTKIAVAFVKGLQSEKVVATPKHFAANFVGDGGRDSNVIHFSERILREIYFPAFEAVVKEAGALSIMAAYNSLDGMPCSCNKWLLTDILRKEWKFKGFVVSDYCSVVGIYNLHNVCKTKAETAQKALLSGMDVELPYIDCFGELIKLVKKGKISQSILNESVGRILRVKFWLGLFENFYVDTNYAVEINDCDTHRKLALEAARKSIILLKNDNILPLNKDIKSIAVIGPNANEIRLGGYSGFGIKVITPLKGIKNKVSSNTEVYFSEGCKVKINSKEGFKEAIEIAQKSQIVIMFMGNNNGGLGLENESEGEGRDRCNLDLPGVQEDLIKEISNVQKNIIVVLINGSAITMTKWIDSVSAVIEAWYAGEEAGNAISDVIFGDYNPGGKLTITFPQVVGQLPLYYNYKPTGRIYDYDDLRGKQPLFAFGYGLSYTEFKYSNLEIKKEKKFQIKISADIENSGKYKGDEIVQLYIHDTVSSISRPLKELKGFKRITLEPNEKKNVEFVLTEKDFSFLNEKLKPVIEKGTFEIMLGSSSEDIKLTGNIEI